MQNIHLRRRQAVYERLDDWHRIEAASRINHQAAMCKLRLVGDLQAFAHQARPVYELGDGLHRIGHAIRRRCSGRDGVASCELERVGVVGTCRKIGRGRAHLDRDRPDGARLLGGGSTRATTGCANQQRPVACQGGRCYIRTAPHPSRDQLEVSAEAGTRCHQRRAVERLRQGPHARRRQVTVVCRRRRCRAEAAGAGRCRPRWARRQQQQPPQRRRGHLAFAVVGVPAATGTARERPAGKPLSHPLSHGAATRLARWAAAPARARLSRRPRGRSRPAPNN